MGRSSLFTVGAAGAALLSAAALGLTLAGCGSSPECDSFNCGNPDGGDGGLPPDDGSPGFDVDNFPDAAQHTYGCSPDLQSVIDEKGNVVSTCPPDEGCNGGKCVAACDAAAAAHGSVGCDFVIATPSFEQGHKSPCFVVFLANNWSKDVGITVSRGGTTYDVTKFGKIPSVGTATTSWPAVPSTGLPPGQVAVLFMSSDPNATNLNSIACPVPDAINASTAVWNNTAITGRGEAFHVTTDVPVNGYDVIPYGGARSYLPSAELLLPTTAWGTNYITATPPASTGQHWGQIVAAKDNTQVTILPTIDLPAGTNVIAAPKNTATKYTLNAGEYIQWQTNADISGSIISSTNPVMFSGGHGIFCLTSATSTGGGCDSDHDIVPPVSALGDEYVGAPYVTRRKDLKEESIRYRLVGAVDGTTLTYDPAVSGAPTSASSGQVLDFEAVGGFTVKSQDDKHPFFLAQMQPGCNVTGGSRPGVDPQAPFASNNCLGDEEWNMMVPPAQFLSKYVFFTDPTYPTTTLAITRKKTSQGFADVTVDCLGTVTGWKPVGSGGDYEVAGVDLIRAFQPNGKCNNGPHVASSTGPFGLVVWGNDSYSSYGYAAGGNFSTINTVVVPPVPK